MRASKSINTLRKTSIINWKVVGNNSSKVIKKDESIQPALWQTKAALQHHRCQIPPTQQGHYLSIQEAITQILSQENFA